MISCGIFSALPLGSSSHVSFRLKRVRHVVLPYREEMGVGVGDRDRGVPYPLGDGGSGKPEVDEQRHMAVAQVVNADSGKTSLLRGDAHLLSHLVMCEGEYPLARLDSLQVHHRAQLLFEKRRHLHDAS